MESPILLYSRIRLLGLSLCFTDKGAITFFRFIEISFADDFPWRMHIEYCYSAVNYIPVSYTHLDVYKRQVWNYMAAVIDIAVLAYVIYKFLLLIRGTRAVQLLKGLIVLLIVYFLSDTLGLHAVNWLLSEAWAVLFLALAVIFQPEDVYKRQDKSQTGASIPGLVSKVNVKPGDKVEEKDRKSVV